MLEDYFGYKITFVMNVTDVDDKIILRARRDFLFETYRKEHDTVTPEVIEDVTKSLEEMLSSQDAKMEKLKEESSRASTPEIAATLLKERELLKEKRDALSHSVQSLLSPSSSSSSSANSSLSLSHRRCS